MAKQTVDCGFTVLTREVSVGQEYVNDLRKIILEEKLSDPISYKPKGQYGFTYHEYINVPSAEAPDKLSMMLKRITNDEDFVNEFSNLLANNVKGLHRGTIVVWEDFKELYIGCENADLSSVREKYRLFFTKVGDYLQGAVYVKVDLSLYFSYRKGETK